MGSVTFDAGNTFFGQPHHHQSHHTYSSRDSVQSRHTAPSPPKRARSPSRTDTSMSQSRRTGRRSPVDSVHHATSSSRQGSQSRHQPASPSMAPTTSPPAPQMSGADDHETPSVQSRRACTRNRIKIRDLEEIRRLAREDMNAFSEIRHQRRSRSHGTSDESPQYEISDMRVEHIIEMVAGLLTKITTTNDQQHEHLHRQSHLENTHISSQTNSVLAFHGKNVPSITILSYLSRINKYCPTSYEVFMSLLVYFDRMTERINTGPMLNLQRADERATKNASTPAHGSSANSDESDDDDSDEDDDNDDDADSADGGNGSDQDAMQGVTATTPKGTQTATPPSSGGLEKTSRAGVPGTPHSRPQPDPAAVIDDASFAALHLSNFFVVDSFNIHRLVIAGVTCASKFFSDIFYTNSRYAKVGGLPLPELNHLELQFLLLNDFRLSVPAEEIDAYGTMLVEFYAREVVAQERAAAAAALSSRSLSESSTESTATVRAAT